MATKNQPSDSARHDENRAEDDQNRHEDDENRVEDDGSRPDPEPLAGLIGFERDLLFTVARLEGSNPHGVAVREELEAHYGEEINQGRLYQNLRSLVDADHIHTLPLDGRTKVYRLTDTGQQHLRRRAADWQGYIAQLQSLVLPAVRRVAANR